MNIHLIKITDAPNTNKGTHSLITNEKNDLEKTIKVIQISGNKKKITTNIANRNLSIPKLASQFHILQKRQL